MSIVDPSPRILTAKSVLGKLARLPLRLVPAEARVRVRKGPLKGLRWIVGSHIHGCWLGTYEREKADLFAGMLRDGGVMYDIGANVGYYAPLSSRLVGTVGHVYAFEPSPRNLEYLKQHVLMNDMQNVTVYDVGVSDSPGEASFDLGVNPASGHLQTDHATAPSGKTVKVRLVSLDDMLSRQVIRPPDWIKIDVEGGEEQVLSGMTACMAKHRPIILLATHSRRLHDSCVATLKAAGYKLRVLEEPTVGTDLGEVLATAS